MGFSQASHFITNGQWTSIADLMRPEEPFRLDFWRANQLNHFLRSLPSPKHFERALTTYEIYCSEEGALPHTLVAYQLLHTSR